MQRKSFKSGVLCFLLQAGRGLHSGLLQVWSWNYTEDATVLDVCIFNNLSGFISEKASVVFLLSYLNLKSNFLYNKKKFPYVAPVLFRDPGKLIQHSYN